MSRGLGAIQKDVLDLMAQVPGHRWTAREITGALRGEDPATMNPAKTRGTRAMMEALAARGLISIIDAPPVDGRPQPRLYRLR